LCEPCPNSECYDPPPVDEAAKRCAEIESADGQTSLAIPRQYHGAVFADFAGAQAELERFYARSRPGLLTVLGACGVGKTRLAYALVRQSYADGRACELHHAPTLLEELAATRGIGRAKELGRRECLMILDDILGEDPPPHQVRLLSVILYRREQWGLPTMLTCNLSVDGISALSERIASRVAGGLVLELGGEDRRLA